MRNVDMLAHYGGEGEFTAFVPAVRGRADIDEITQRLQRCFDEPFALEGHVFRSSPSVGISMYPGDSDTLESLLSTGDVCGKAQAAIT